MPQGTNTIKCITKADLTNNKQPTYGQLVCDIRIQKQETHRTRITVGGYRIYYPDDKSTPAIDLTTSECLINTTLSTPNAKFLVAYINFFYLKTTNGPLQVYEIKWR